MAEVVAADICRHHLCCRTFLPQLLCTRLCKRDDGIGNVTFLGNDMAKRARVHYRLVGNGNWVDRNAIYAQQFLLGFHEIYVANALQVGLG